MLSLTEGGTNNDTPPLFGGQAAATPPSAHTALWDAEQVLASSAGHPIFHAHDCNLSSARDCRKKQMSSEQV